MRRRPALVLLVPLLCAAALIGHHLGTRAGTSAPPVVTAPTARASAEIAPSTGIQDDDRPGPVLAAAAFVDAFLDRGPDRRAHVAKVASDRLTALLARTDPAKIPRARPVQDPWLVGVTDAVTTMSQRLSDGSTLTVDLVPDPTRRYGWAVTSVRPGDR